MRKRSYIPRTSCHDGPIHDIKLSGMKFGNKSHLNAKPRLIKFKVYNEAIQKALPIKNLAVIADDFSIRQTSTASPLITEIPVTRFTRVFKMYPQNSIYTNFI